MRIYIFILLLFAQPKSVLACKCEIKTKEQVDVVAIGRVVNVELMEREHSFASYLRASVEIQKCIKGDCNFKYVTAFEGAGSCGIGLEHGGVFYFQLENSSKKLEFYGLDNYVGLCTGSRRISGEVK